MIAVDTNILVYAHRGDSKFHAPAERALAALAEGNSPWAIPFPCIHEFVSVVTSPRIYSPPTPLEIALDQIEAWIESPQLRLLSERDNYWSEFKRQCLRSQIVGPKVHDARIISICIDSGVKKLWTADRDFSRFNGIELINPLI